MLSKRFIFLVGILVTLNLALWFAAPGLALRRSIVQQLFGPKLVRAEVVKKDGSDWRLDRGVITSVSSTLVTLREADGRIQQIPLSDSTKVIRSGHHLSVSVLAPRWRVLVAWPADGAAQSVDVERVPRAHKGKGVR